MPGGVGGAASRDVPLSRSIPDDSVRWANALGYVRPTAAGTRGWDTSRTMTSHFQLDRWGRGNHDATIGSR